MSCVQSITNVMMIQYLTILELALLVRLWSAVLLCTIWTHLLTREAVNHAQMARSAKDTLMKLQWKMPKSKDHVDRDTTLGHWITSADHVQRVTTVQTTRTLIQSHVQAALMPMRDKPPVQLVPQDTTPRWEVSIAPPCLLALRESMLEPMTKTSQCALRVHIHPGVWTAAHPVLPDSSALRVARKEVLGRTVVQRAHGA